MKLEFIPAMLLYAWLLVPSASAGDNLPLRIEALFGKMRVVPDYESRAVLVVRQEHCCKVSYRSESSFRLGKPHGPFGAVGRVLSGRR